MTDKNDKPSEPFDRHAARRKAREERLAAALRANLKRRKTAPKPIVERPPGAVDDRKD